MALVALGQLNELLTAFGEPEALLAEYQRLGADVEAAAAAEFLQQK